MEQINFRKLTADELEARVASVGISSLTVLIYKNARVDMAVLDETVGPMNWARDHKELKGNIYCGIGIYDTFKSEWVWKWDCGAESYTEKEKGEASDSFKRAGFNWGIGRELYTCPPIFFDKSDVIIKQKNGKDTTYDHFAVEEIEYDGDKVSRLVVVDEKTQAKFVWDKNKKKSAAKKTTTKKEDPKLSPEDEKKAELKRLLQETNSDTTLFLVWCGKKFKREVKAVDELTDRELDLAILQVKQKEKK